MWQFSSLFISKYNHSGSCNTEVKVLPVHFPYFNNIIKSLESSWHCLSGWILTFKLIFLSEFFRMWMLIIFILFSMYDLLHFCIIFAHKCIYCLYWKPLWKEHLIHSEILSRLFNLKSIPPPLQSLWSIVVYMHFFSKYSMLSFRIVTCLV